MKAEGSSPVSFLSLGSTTGLVAKMTVATPAETMAAPKLMSATSAIDFIDETCESVQKGLHASLSRSLFLLRARRPKVVPAPAAATAKPPKPQLAPGPRPGPLALAAKTRPGT